MGVLSTLPGAIRLLLAGALLIGFAQIAITPPFEGFDETTHYSYIAQLADTGRWPNFGDPISADVEAITQITPLPESAHTAVSYSKFFQGSAASIAAAGARLHAPRDPALPWRNGATVNWEAQHPPLYYAMMVPLYRATKGVSVIGQLFALRSLSYLIAWAGLVLAVFAALRMPLAGQGAPVAFALALWPALFPTWFPEMARIGNDGLVLLIAVPAWWLLVRLTAPAPSLRDYALFGLACGLGLLTKVTFAPFVAVAGCYLLWRLWRQRQEGAGHVFVGLVLFAVAIAIVAGWWYVMRAVETGHLLATSDSLSLEQEGGLVARLKQNFAAADFARGLLVTVMTFLWSGTWSFVTPGLWPFVPMLLLLAVLAFGVVVRRDGLREPSNLLGLLTLALFCAALFQQALVLMARLGPSVVPAWYLHSFAPVLAGVLALGLIGTMESALRRLMMLLILYAPFFMLFAMFGQVLFYAGCESRRPGLADHIFSSAPCGIPFGTLYDRLAVLAFPGAALVLLIAGWLLMIAGVVGALRALAGSGAAQAS
jgi:hypothetical protein